ncbi:MAG: hypothetical protein Q8O00_16835 [Holophaga sp.]|nr:hypothetical protein [Holophaga sp.]
MGWDGFGLRGLALGLCALAAQSVWGQGNLGTQSAKNWAWDQVKSWSYYRKDASGQRIWNSVKFFDLSYTEQTENLLERLRGSETDRRAALVVLSDRPLEQWASPALRRAGDRDEVALFLYHRGFKYSDREAYLYMEPGSRLDRPWTHGLGLHLDGATWRFQWIPNPSLLPKLEANGQLPKGLDRAAQPSALLRLKQLQPGLAKLQSLAGGEAGIVKALAQGTRAGFLLRHIGPWIKQAAPVLEPLAQREAWVLHYGTVRGAGPSAGTLIFIPGDLPTRTKLALELLKLNPTSKGARVRTAKLGDGKEVTQVRGSGGVLNLWVSPEGTWISDKAGTLGSVISPTAQVSLGERLEWCKVALAAVNPGTDVSLWIVPRFGATAAFERTVIRRRMQGLAQQTWPNPFIAKAAPRSGAISAALGAGPTEAMMGAILRIDREETLVEPALATFADGGKNLSPQQQQQYQAEINQVKARNVGRKGLRAEVAALQGLLDLRGAAFLWNGWTVPQPLSPAQRAALTEFQKLKREGAYQASRLERQGKVQVYGGYGEPGMSPSLALALPIQAGKGAQVEDITKKLWTKLFKGKAQNREYAKGILIHRIVTEQTFTPAYAIVNDTLVLGSDDDAVQAVMAGLLGQAPTLADLPSNAFGRVAIDGEKAAKDLEALLLSYLRINHGGRYWWFGEPSPSEDEAAAEVASTFGPFLGALRGLGRQTLEVNLTSAGFEARPK